MIIVVDRISHVRKSGIRYRVLLFNKCIERMIKWQRGILRRKVSRAYLEKES
jgi:hypothetical protein